MADVSRRVAQLESEVAELRRALGANAKPAAFSFPRERWLGRTVARSASYPEPGEGNTFEVELLSSAFAPVAPGNSALTNRPRGPVVVARTWPAQYLAEGTYCTVDRIKGPDVGGEWWIAGGGAQADEVKYAILSGFVLQSGGQVGPEFSGSGWEGELLSLVEGDVATTPNGTALGNAGICDGGRLKMLIPGRYLLQANCTFKVQYSLPEVPIAANLDWWGVRLDCGGVDPSDISAVPGANATGVASGVAGSLVYQYFTVFANDTISVSNSEFVPMKISGLNGFSYYVSQLVFRPIRWSMVLVKISDLE